MPVSDFTVNYSFRQFSWIPLSLDRVAAHDAGGTADTEGVTRGLGLLLALLSLATAGGLLLAQGKSQGPTSAAATQAESQAVATAASAIFSPVDQVLQVDDSQSGTYVGAELPVGSGVTLVRATASSYCLEANLSGTQVHEDGPGGTPAVGPC
jgi:hypothetical protein